MRADPQDPHVIIAEELGKASGFPSSLPILNRQDAPLPLRLSSTRRSSHSPFMIDHPLRCRKYMGCGSCQELTMMRSLRSVNRSATASMPS
jgi:hypothetical protein